MKQYINNSVRTGIVAMASLLACYSCSDSWDDHYKASSNGTVVDATLYQQMKSDASLSDFIEVIDAAGYKALLDENQLVTVFAPVNGTFNKDSLLSEIKKGESAKELVITRFVKNHIARYNYSSTAEEQDITLLNQKLTTLQSGIVGKDQITTKSVNTICNNGILHVLNSQLPFHANIYESMETDESVSSMYNFLHFYDEDSLDVNRSVYRGVDEDGNRIYVDSVIISTNDLMSNLDAYIDREDSNYVAIIPTNGAYDARLEEVKTYFNYPAAEEDRDSLCDYYSNNFVMNTLFYNNNANLHQEDSIVATTYRKSEPRYLVFYDPFEAAGSESKKHHGPTTEDGILAPGKYFEKVTCSNGTIYKVDDIPTSIYDAFFHPIEIECEYTGLINQDVDEKENGIYTKNCTYSGVTLNNKGLSKNGYLDVQGQGSSQPYVSFNVNNVLSGTYDMYLVTVPLKMGENVAEADSLKPYQFRVNMWYRNATDGTWPSKTNETLKNPEDSKSNNFVSNPEAIDTIFLGTKTFPNCYYASRNVGVMIQVQAYVSSSQLKTYSRRMLLDCLILKPHQEEATEPEESEESSVKGK